MKVSKSILNGLLAGLLAGGCCMDDFIVPDEIDYDFFEAAIDLTPITNTCSADAAFTTSGATPDLTTGSCLGIPNSQFNRWFKFTAGVNGEMRIMIDVDGAKGTQKKTLLTLWESDGTTQVACSRYANASDDVWLAATTLTPGDIYFISVDTEDAASQGTFTCCLKDVAGFVFASNADSDDVTVIDVATLSDVSSITCSSSFCNEPRNLATSPNGLLLYVPYRHSDLVSVVDPFTQNNITDITHVSIDEPYAVAFTQDSREAWVVNKQGGGSSTGSVTIINTENHTVVDTIQHASINSPEGIVIANGKAYIANRGNGNVPVFDLITRNHITTIVAVASESRYAVATPTGNLVYVGNGSNLLKINTSSNTITSTISLPGSSRNLAMMPDGSTVFIATQSDVIYAVDVATNAITPITFMGASSLYGVAVSKVDNTGFATDENQNRVYFFNALNKTTITDAGGNPDYTSTNSTPRAITSH